MKILGPLSTDFGGGTRILYVDMSNQLDYDETVISIDALIPSDNDVNVSNITILDSDLITKDGHILPGGKAIAFRVSCDVPKNKLVNLIIDYLTNKNNTDSTIVKLKLVRSI